MGSKKSLWWKDCENRTFYWTIPNESHINVIKFEMKLLTFSANIIMFDEHGSDGPVGN